MIAHMIHAVFLGLYPLWLGLCYQKTQDAESPGFKLKPWFRVQGLETGFRVYGCIPTHMLASTPLRSSAQAVLNPQPAG